ncbi:hypothetical protein RRG08_031830 [Elysia crispata]|uniref:Uncharacterized protein n=1 Tax=Elysia crispata TaxID=231223 RepID=A0AAE0Y5V0_9GAST|nr:hypothetical protein RRG08_031830 [Elysia crispata]
MINCTKFRTGSASTSAQKAVFAREARPIWPKTPDSCQNLEFASQRHHDAQGLLPRPTNGMKRKIEVLQGFFWNLLFTDSSLEPRQDGAEFRP